jgi:hypothetical protein
MREPGAVKHHESRAIINGCLEQFIEFCRRRVTDVTLGSYNEEGAMRFRLYVHANKEFSLFPGL